MPTKYPYQKSIYNKYLNKSKIIKASTPWELEYKIKEQQKLWSDQEQKSRQKNKMMDLKEKALLLTQDATEKTDQYRNILNHSLNCSFKFSWDKFKRNDPYKEFVFQEQVPKLEDVLKEYNPPSKSFWEIIFTSMRIKRETIEEKATHEFNSRMEAYNSRKEYEFSKYQAAKESFYSNQNEHNASIDQWMKDFEAGTSSAIEKYIDHILFTSKYPEELEKDYEIQYIPDSKMLLLSYKLPSPPSIPRTVEYKFVTSRKEIVPREMKKKEFEDFYDSVICQITLRVIHEIFMSVHTSHIAGVIFNGWVQYIDEATGQETSSCILSLQTTKQEFQNINLSLVDYKKCVKNLKGLFASKLINLSPVKPIKNISTEDSRFVASKDILSDLYSIENLATMDWNDFEHLVRQLFEKIFSKDGCEVKVTKASRDWGIDAIVFDNDPITGGKYVIQAKRYNNTVSPSAVRDLHGAMMHEGANKGILVTTSSFGPESYEYAKNKPIELIDGQELLHLFNTYGYHNVNIILERQKA